MSAEAWALSWAQPWDAALDRMQEDLDRVERHLSDGALDAGPAAPATMGGLATLPALEGTLPEHLGERARGLLARTDALAGRVTGELSRTGRELREVAGRAPEPAAAAVRRGHRHPAFLDTRA